MYKRTFFLTNLHLPFYANVEREKTDSQDLAVNILTIRTILEKMFKYQMYEANCAIELNYSAFSKKKKKKKKRTQFFEIIFEEKRRQFVRLVNDHGEELTNNEERGKNADDDGCSFYCSNRQKTAKHRAANNHSGYCRSEQETTNVVVKLKHSFVRSFHRTTYKSRFGGKFKKSND